MTNIKLDHFLPQSSFFKMPDFNLAGSEDDLFVGKVAQAVLTLHRKPVDASLNPERIAIELNETVEKVKSAYEKIQGHGGSAETTDLSPTSALSAFLLCLEDRSLTLSSLVQRFRSLPREIQGFLCLAVAETHGKTDISYGMGKIEEDPTILLRIHNELEQNLLEEALETLHKQEIYSPLLSELESLQTYVPTADKTLLSRVTTSPLFSLLCYFVWWEDGGKDNPHFGSFTHGEDRIRENPEILRQRLGESTSLERLHKEIQSQAMFHARTRTEKEPSLRNSQRDKTFYEALSTQNIRPTTTASEDTPTFLKRTECYVPQLRLEVFRSILKDKPFPKSRAELQALLPLVDAKEFVEAVKILAKINPRETSLNISSYGIKESEELSSRDQFHALVEIAKIAATEDGETLSLYLSRYCIASFDAIPVQEKFYALVDILKIAAANGISLSSQSRFIATFEGISPEIRFNALIEILKIAAAKNAYGVSIFIDSWGIRSFTGISTEAKFHALVEIAKSAASYKGLGMAEFIDRYGLATFEGISTEAKFHALVEIAKIAAANASYSTSKFIEKFGLTSFEEISLERKFNALVEIAKIAATKGGCLVSICIANYGIATFPGISSERKFNALIEIAKMAAAHNAHYLSEFIANYGIGSFPGISSEIKFNALIEIAKIAVANSGWYVSMFIANYGIASFEGISPKVKFDALLAIAEMATADQTSVYSIAGYGLATLPGVPQTDKFNALVNLAKRNATLNGHVTSRDMLDYGIATLYEIPSIDRFNALVEIAKLSATGEGEYTSKHIDNYGIATLEGISDRDKFNAMVEIAKIAALNNGKGTLRNIDKYDFASFAGISDEEKLDVKHKIAKIGILSATEDFDDILNILLKDLPNDYYLGYLCMMRAGSIDEYQLSPKSKLPNPSSLGIFYSKTSPILTLLSAEAKEFETAPPERKEHIYNLYLMHFAMAKLLTLSLKEPYVSNAATKAALEAILFQIMEYPNSPMQSHLAFVLTELCRDPSFYLDMISTFTTEKTKTLNLLHITIADLALQAGKSKEEIRAIHAKFSNFNIFKSSSDLANALNMLQSLHRCVTLSPTQKIKLLERICSHELIQDAFNKEISQIFALLELSISKKGWPKDLPEEFTSEELHATFISCIKTDLFAGIDLTPEEIKLIEERYFPLKNKMRRPFGLEVYASRISSLGNRPLMEAFKRFVMSLLKGTYREERYKTEGNPHLEKMKKEFSEIYEAWQTLSSPVAMEEMVSLPAAGGAGGGGAAGGVERARAEEERKASRFSFSGWLKVKLLTDKHLPEFERTCPRLHAFLSKGERPVKKEGELTSIEQIEELCIDLCQTTLSPQNTLAKVKKLKELVESTDPFKSSEWKNDVSGLYRELSTTKQVSSALVMITDDWQQMFLSGTEVSGNCQRIDGDPNLNQCLVSECIDGKMQYAALVHPTTHKIIANAELKLLFVHTKRADGTLLLKPAIFMERIYPDVVKEEHKIALYNAAKARALSLGLDLYQKKPSGATAGHEIYTLESLGSSAPHEYEDGSDGEHGGVTEGTYKIEGIRIS